MKIAVYHNLPSGGAKRALYNYTRGLIDSGHEVDVYAPRSANEEFLDLRPLVRRYYDVPLWSAPSLVDRSVVSRELARYVICRWGLKRHARAAAAAIDAGGYDLAFVHHCQFAQTPYVLDFLATPSVYYCQEPRRASFEYSILHVASPATGLKRVLQRLHTAVFESLLRPRDIEAARSATLILANSSFSVENIKRAYGRYARVAYLGIELEAFRATGRERDRAVVSVGALHPSKGHSMVIDAAGEVPQALRPVVHVVADRKLEGHAQELTDRAAERGVTLCVHEQITDAELVELYSTSRVAVCAAELEPFGFTPLEAMACGTPVVAVREGGYKETVIDGHNGRLLERDAGELGRAITDLLTDHEAWERLSRGALATARLWGVKRAATTLDRLLATLATGPRHDEFASRASAADSA